MCSILDTRGGYVKDRWVPITDPVKAAAIVAGGKYREHLPTWTRQNGVVWVLKPTVGNRL